MAEAYKEEEVESKEETEEASKSLKREDKSSISSSAVFGLSKRDDYYKPKRYATQHYSFRRKSAPGRLTKRKATLAGLQLGRIKIYRDEPLLHSRSLDDVKKSLLDTDINMFSTMKISCEAFQRLYRLQGGMERELFDQQKYLLEEDSVKEDFLKNLLGPSYIHVLSPTLPTNKMKYLLQRMTGSLDTRTTVIPIPLTKGSRIVKETSAKKVFIVNLEVEAKHDLTDESRLLIWSLQNLLDMESLSSNVIYVINTVDQKLKSENDIQLITELSDKIREYLPNQCHNISQYDVFFLDEFELKKRISYAFEYQLKAGINQLTETAMQEKGTSIKNQIDELKKRFDRLKDMECNEIPHETQTALARCRFITSYYIEDETLNVNVTEKSEEIDICIKLALDKHKMKYLVIVKPKPEMKNHLCQGTEISHQENRQEVNYAFGTLGCIGEREDDKLVGYTCKHVVESDRNIYSPEGRFVGKSPDNLCVQPSENISDDYVDFAATEITDERKPDCKLHFKSSTNLDIQIENVTIDFKRDLEWLRNETVYKYGARTSKREGIYKGREFVRFENGARGEFRAIHIIKSSNKDLPFSEPGDSGSLTLHENDEEIKAVFIHIGSYGNDFFSCLVNEALDALSTKSNSDFRLGTYMPFRLVSTGTNLGLSNLQCTPLT